MKAERFFSAAALAGLAMTGWLYLEGNACAEGQSAANALDSEVAEIFSNAPPPPSGFVSKEDYLNSFKNQKDLLNAYRAGKISKEEAMMASERLEMALENKASMDIYGKVIDQNGQPVVGAQVQASIDKGVNFLDAVSEEHQTKTDAQGLFHFLGLHGQGMGIRLQKEGYNYDPNLPSERPANYLPVSNNPLVFTMYKLHGGEPMRHTKIYSDVPCDGSIKRFDLVSNVQMNTGDLMVTLTRNPLVLNSRDRYKPFNWAVTFAITNGGLQEITNLMYPNEAPLNGYQPSLTLNFPTNMVGWKYEFKRDYFFKAQNGQIYGRMTLHVDASRPQPPTYLDAEIYVNPAGSRNLEFDSSKQIIR